MRGFDGYSPESPLGSHLLGTAILVAAFATLAGTGAAIDWLPAAPAGRGLVALGAIGIWRYSWAAVHLTRAVIYQFFAFPRLRRDAEGTPSAMHVYAVVLSYRMAPEINAAVYSALARDLKDYGRPATIVGCVSDPGDAEALRGVKLGAGIELVVIQQSNLGKREAMERALSLLASRPVPPASCVVLMDGDTVVQTGTLRKVAPILTSRPDVGAVTTNNIAAVEGAPRIREWYRLRMQHRHLLMCSMSLSRKVLVLTGRFSLFRAEIALSRGFIACLGHDAVHHWRLGRIRMLTGDDKSTWYWVLRDGWNMLYVPDVSVICLERPPTTGLTRSAIPLMARYYGNMARNNGRAIALGPRRLRWFFWWTLIDQRVSPWTSLVGPVSAVTLSVTSGAGVLVAYLSWVLVSRSVQTLIIGWLSGRIHPYMPFILYFNQVVGSAMKILVFFHLDLQKWTRQGTGTPIAIGQGSSSLIMCLWTSLFTLLLTAIMLAR
jgi:mannuronan synthase